MSSLTISERPHAPDPEAVESPPRGSVEYDGVAPGATVQSTGAVAVEAASATVDGEKVEVSILRPRYRGSTTAEEFEKAAETWASMADHEGCVGLVDWGVEDGRPWLAVERMDGGSLRQRFEVADEAIWPDEAAWIVERLCGAVEAAHDRGITHLGIDPSWVQFRATEPGSWDAPKLGGWGVARHAGVDADAVEGADAAYAAPEQVDPERFGDPDERTDVYRLGAVLYGMLAGRAPFEGTGYEVLEATVGGTPIVPPSEANRVVPGAFDDVVLTALATDPDERYGSVAEFRDALADVEVPPEARTAAVVGEWRQYGGGPANRGVAEGAPGEGDAPEEAWTARADDHVEGPAAVAYGTVYVGDRDGTIYAYRADTGEKRWETTPEEYATDEEDSVGVEEFDVATTPAVVDGTVCFTTDEGLYALDAYDGTRQWSRDRSDDRATVDPREANGRSEEQLWNRSLGVDRRACVTVDDGTVYVPSYAQDGVYAVDLETGDTEWFVGVEDGFRAEELVAPAVADGTLLVNTREGIVAVDLDAREELWEFAGYDPSPPSVDDERVYFGDDDTTYALDVEDGASEWRADTEYELAGAPAVDDDAVYVTVADDYGGVTAFDPESGDVRWEYALEDLDDERTAATQGIVTDESVYLVLDSVLSSRDDATELTAVSADGGIERWRHELPTETGADPAVVDDLVVLGVEYDVSAVSVPEAEDLAPEGESEEDDDRTDTEVLVDLLREQPDNMIDVDYIPDETGWSEQKVERVVDELEAEGIVERDEWEGMVDVVLVEDPSEGGDDGEIEVTSEDAEQLTDLIEAEADGQLMRDMVTMETGWTEAKAEAVVDYLETAGEIKVQQMGEAEFLSIDESGVVGGVDAAAGQARPTADELREQMADPDLAEALEAAVGNAKPDGTVEMMDAMDDLPSPDAWGQMVAKGYLVQSGGAYAVDLPDGVDFEFQG